MRTHAGPVVSFITDTSVDAFARVGRWLGKGFEELDVPFHLVSIRDPKGIRRRRSTATVGLGMGRTYGWLRGIAAYLRHARPSVALAAPAYVVPFALTAGWWTGNVVVPWEASMLGFELANEALNPRMRLVPRLERLTYRWAPAVAAVSEDTGRHVLERVVPGVARPLFVLPNPVDGEEVREMADPPAPRAHETFRMIAVGRLVRSKGFDGLLQALSMAAPGFDRPWEALIVGDGAQRDLLVELASRRGLGGRVSFLGRVDNPYPLMASADILVHPARWEPSSLVILEALSLGLPVAASNAPGGIGDILDGGRFGELVPSEDWTALSDTLVRLARDPDRRRALSRTGPARAAHYDPVAMARRALQLVDMVGAPAPSGPVGEEARR